MARLSPAGATLPALPVGESPRSVVRDGKGNLWVGNFTGQSVTQLGADGTVIGTYPVEGNVTSVAVDSAGTVWAAAMAAKKVFKLAP